MPGIRIKSTTRVAHGLLVRFEHDSVEIMLPMTASLFIPLHALTLEDALKDGGNFPVLMYLSGLTCTDENVCIKGHPFTACMENKMAMIMPDTSPRGAGVEGEDIDWDFGTGAGFYVDATASQWKTHYRMYSYVTKELPQLLQAEFTSVCDTSRMGISGHSMGGHGALQIAFKNTNLFKSVSAFSPICNPKECAWGQKAFTGYFGEDNATNAYTEYDSSIILSKGAPKDSNGNNHYDDILVDFGSSDQFLDGQLLPDSLEDAATASNQKLTLRKHIGYDHSYYFVSTFLPEHIAFHAKRLAL
jgi:S-formylglutathione hydrolase